MTNYARELSEPSTITDIDGKYGRKRIARAFDQIALLNQEAKRMSTKVELNPASNIMQACKQFRIAVNQGNISESVTIAGEIEQMANDLCMYLQALAAEMTERKQSLPLGWTDWLQIKNAGQEESK